MQALTQAPSVPPDDELLEEELDELLELDDEELDEELEELLEEEELLELDDELEDDELDELLTTGPTEHQAEVVKLLVGNADSEQVKLPVRSA